MKRVGILAALCAVLAAVLMIRFAQFGAVPQRLPETAAPPDEPTRPAIYRSIAVKDRDGFHHTVRTAPDVDVVVMATWCPYSQELKGFISDPAVRPYLANRRFVFLFEADESPHGSPFANESFFDGLPGEIYVVEDTEGLGVTAFPMFYSAQTTLFELDRTSWAVQRLGMPRQLARDLLSRHAVQ